MKMKKISIKKIAELSGVSVATVSRVINNNGRFSEETRQHVLNVIKENNYGMNYIAKGLRMNKSYTIGILVPDISNAFFSSVVKRIEEYLYLKSYSVIICNTDRDREKELSYLRILEGKMVDGLFIISGDQEFDTKIIQTKVPVVCIDRRPKDVGKVAFISSDHYQGGFLATECLIQRGCKKIGILVSSENLYSSRERLRGYKDALIKHHLIFNENDVVIIANKAAKTEESRKQILERLNNGDAFDGVFAINDRLAIGAIKAAMEFGINVPRDMKIIGFDNDPVSSYCSPQLTSVKQDIEHLAEKSCETLLQLMNNQETTQSDIYKLLPVSIIYRGTT
ncbi:MAG: LacI family DNA-binding transcriptional regulator [Sporolactobacillus sp.]